MDSQPTKSLPEPEPGTPAKDLYPTRSTLGSAQGDQPSTLEERGRVVPPPSLPGFEDLQELRFIQIARVHRAVHPSIQY
jgi:hypothetical protein